MIAALSLCHYQNAVTYRCRASSVCPQHPSKHQPMRPRYPSPQIKRKLNSLTETALHRRLSAVGQKINKSINLQIRFSHNQIHFINSDFSRHIKRNKKLKKKQGRNSKKPSRAVAELGAPDSLFPARGLRSYSLSPPGH